MVLKCPTATKLLNLELNAIEGHITAFYDTLYTQGKAYIVDSLLEYIYHHDPLWLPKDYHPFQVTTQQT